MNSAAFDLTAACTGMIYGMVTAEQFIKSGMYENVLVIGSETLSKFWIGRTFILCCLEMEQAVVMSKTDKGGASSI